MPGATERSRHHSTLSTYPAVMEYICSLFYGNEVPIAMLWLTLSQFSAHRKLFVIAVRIQTSCCDAKASSKVLTVYLCAEAFTKNA